VSLIALTSAIKTDTAYKTVLAQGHEVRDLLTHILCIVTVYIMVCGGKCFHGN